MEVHVTPWILNRYQMMVKKIKFVLLKMIETFNSLLLKWFENFPRLEKRSKWKMIIFDINFVVKIPFTSGNVFFFKKDQKDHKKLLPHTLYIFKLKNSNWNKF